MSLLLALPLRVFHSCSLTAADSAMLLDLESAADVCVRKAEEGAATFLCWLDWNDPCAVPSERAFSVLNPAKGYAKDTQYHDTGL